MPDGQVQTAADGLGDLANGMPRPDRVPRFASRLFSQAPSGIRGGIADVHGDPEVRAVSGVADDAFLLSRLRSPRQEAQYRSCCCAMMGSLHGAEDRTPARRGPSYGFPPRHYGNRRGALVLPAAAGSEPGRPSVAGRPRPSPGLPILLCQVTSGFFRFRECLAEGGHLLDSRRAVTASLDPHGREAGHWRDRPFRFVHHPSSSPLGTKSPVWPGRRGRVAVVCARR